MSQLVLPALPDGFTVPFVTEALRSVGVLGPSAQVVDVQLEPVGEGSGMMSDLARLRLQYDTPDPSLPVSPGGQVRGAQPGPIAKWP